MATPQILQWRFYKRTFVRLIHSVEMPFQTGAQEIDDEQYQVWRRQFLRSRLQLGLGIAMVCVATIGLMNFLHIVLNPIQAEADFAVRPSSIIICNGFILLGLVGCWILHRTAIGQRHPNYIFLGMSWSVALPIQVIATLNGFAYPDIITWNLLFATQAMIVPVCWRLHLVSQVSVLGYYLIVNSILGLAPDDTSNYVLLVIGFWTIWLCTICNAAVYLYEKLKRAELQSRQKLQQFLHTVSHDLRQSVATTASAFQTLSNPSGDTVTIDRPILERLRDESEHNLTLIHTLLNTHHPD